MNEQLHITKAERIERSLASLTLDHYEAVIEGAMLAGSHWFNVLLHRGGFVAESTDVMHAEFLSVGARRKIATRMAGELMALDRIEELRTSHVRGDMPNGQNAARDALAGLATLRNAVVNSPASKP